MFYVKYFQHLLFWVRENTKLQRERSVFCPGLFREERDLLWGQARPTEKEPLSASTVREQNINFDFQLKTQTKLKQQLIKTRLRQLASLHFATSWRAFTTKVCQNVSHDSQLFIFWRQFFLFAENIYGNSVLHNFDRILDDLHKNGPQNQLPHQILLQIPRQITRF